MLVEKKKLPLDCEPSLFSSKIREKEHKTSKRANDDAAAASSVGAGRRAKRETAMVPYNATLTGNNNDTSALF